jgi:hypothetical protein
MQVEIPVSYSECGMLMLAAAVAIWRAVSEDWAPFDVDVTTIQPPAGFDARFISHVCIGGDGAWYGEGESADITDAAESAMSS